MKRKMLYIITTLALVIGAFIVGKITTDSVITTETKIVNMIPKSYINTESENFKKHYVDVREITNIVTVGNAYIIYLNNGNYYMWLQEG